MNPFTAVEMLFYALFGQSDWKNLKVKELVQPSWTELLFKVVHGFFMLTAVVVLINLLIAMMSNTYQKIQARSDIQWKYGLSKLIRNMHRCASFGSYLNPVCFIYYV